MLCYLSLQMNLRFCGGLASRTCTHTTCILSSTYLAGKERENDAQNDQE
jgi:hypothetical protein